MRSTTLGLLALALLCLTPTDRLTAAETEPTPEQLEFFEKHVRPVFVRYCHECHSGDEPKASLRLDVRSGMMQGGDSGPAVVPGKPEESLLVASVKYEPDADYKMPPKGKLPPDDLAAIIKWVEIGAPWPAESG
ncbi:MAG TPA: c-type cytochrome domain-containing protein, partial [Pirellulales bacterium]